MLAIRTISLLVRVLPAIIRSRQTQRKMAKLSTSDGGSTITKDERVIIVRESVLEALEAIVGKLDD